MHVVDRFQAVNIDKRQYERLGRRPRPVHLPSQLHHARTSSVHTSQVIEGCVCSLHRRRSTIGPVGAPVNDALSSFAGPRIPISERGLAIVAGHAAFRRRGATVIEGSRSISSSLLASQRKSVEHIVRTQRTDPPRALPGFIVTPPGDGVASIGFPVTLFGRAVAVGGGLIALRGHVISVVRSQVTLFGGAVSMITGLVPPMAGPAAILGKCRPRLLSGRDQRPDSRHQRGRSQCDSYFRECGPSFKSCRGGLR